MSETIHEARSDETSDREPSHEESREGRDEGQSRVKVTDKRIFRPDGELREEYSFLDQKTKPAPDGAQAPAEKAAEPKAERPAEKTSPVGTPTERPSPISTPGAETPGAGAASSGPSDGPADAPTSAPKDAPRDVPGYDAGPEKMSFLNLLSILAEPVAVYLGDVQLPDGRSAENLEMARLHIDLLEVLREKTQGNRTADETAILDDLLYRLRMRYVQKSGG